MADKLDKVAHPLARSSNSTGYAWFEKKSHSPSAIRALRHQAW